MVEYYKLNQVIYDEDLDCLQVTLGYDKEEKYYYIGVTPGLKLENSFMYKIDRVYINGYTSIRHRLFDCKRRTEASRQKAEQLYQEQKQEAINTYLNKIPQKEKKYEIIEKIS